MLAIKDINSMPASMHKWIPQEGIASESETMNLWVLKCGHLIEKKFLKQNF